MLHAAVERRSGRGERIERWRASWCHCAGQRRRIRLTSPLQSDAPGPPIERTSELPTVARLSGSVIRIRQQPAEKVRGEPGKAPRRVRTVAALNPLLKPSESAALSAARPPVAERSFHRTARGETEQAARPWFGKLQWLAGQTVAPCCRQRWSGAAAVGKGTSDGERAGAIAQVNVGDSA